MNIKNNQWDYIIGHFFQDKINKLFNGLTYIRAFIINPLIISNGNFEDHLNKVKILWNILIAAGFKVNTEKLIFTRDRLEYLGCKITRQGIISLPDLQAIKHIAVPNNWKQLRSFTRGE